MTGSQLNLSLLLLWPMVDRQTDGHHTVYRPCSAYYAGSPNNTLRSTKYYILKSVAISQLCVMLYASICMDIG